MTQGIPATGETSTPSQCERSGLDEHLERIAVDPISALTDFADQAGYAPQKRQLLAVTIAGVSAAAGTPVNVLLAGEFSDGKSMVCDAAQKLIGPEFLASTSAIQKLTAAAMSRMGPRLTGHAVYLDERSQTNADFESLLRSVASGQPATRIITVKGESVELTVKPPMAIVDLALLDRAMSRQDRSRYLRLRMGSDEKTRDEISRLSLRRFTLDGRRKSRLLTDFSRALQIFLAQLSRDLTVVVPYAYSLQLKVRSRFRDRLLGNFINAVCVVAWLRQGKRDHHRDDEIGAYILADHNDYATVYDMVTAIGDDGSDGQLGDTALTLIRCWASWVRDNGNQGRARSKFDTITNGALSTWRTYRALRELAEAGYATGPTGRGQSGEWRLTDLGLAAEHPNLFNLLPSPDRIADRMQNCKSPS